MTKENLIEKIKSLVPNDTEMKISHNDVFVHDGTKYLLWEIMNDNNVLWLHYETNTTIGTAYSVLSDFDTEILQHILDTVQANKQID